MNFCFILLSPARSSCLPCIRSLLLSNLPLASHISFSICCRRAKRQLRSRRVPLPVNDRGTLAQRGGSRYQQPVPRSPNTLPEMPSDEIYPKKCFYEGDFTHIQAIIHSACGGARNTLNGNTASCLNARLEAWGFKFLKNTSPHDVSRCLRHAERKKLFSWISKIFVQKYPQMACCSQVASGEPWNAVLARCRARSDRDWSVSVPWVSARSLSWASLSSFAAP